jgi:hypothetical protein
MKQNQNALAAREQAMNVNIEIRQTFCFGTRRLPLHNVLRCLGEDDQSLINAPSVKATFVTVSPQMTKSNILQETKHPTTFDLWAWVQLHQKESML